MKISHLLWLGCGIGLLLLVVLISSPAQGDGATPTPEASVAKMSDPIAWMHPPPSGPTQADKGAYTYWMRCMVCHGDRGQGLAVFRYSYPKADQNCATSKCHGGPNPGAGFSFPDAPAIMGPGTLTRFKTAADLYAFVSTKMPYQAPGVLSGDEYWGLVAYLLKQRSALPDGIQLDMANAGSVPVNPGSDVPIHLIVVGVTAVAALTLGVLVLMRHKSAHAVS